jgi:hypothetical protein
LARCRRRNALQSWATPRRAAADGRHADQVVGDRARFAEEWRSACGAQGGAMERCSKRKDQERQRRDETPFSTGSVWWPDNGSPRSPGKEVPVWTMKSGGGCGPSSPSSWVWGDVDCRVLPAALRHRSRSRGCACMAERDRRGAMARLLRVSAISFVPAPLHRSPRSGVQPQVGANR